MKFSVTLKDTLFGEATFSTEAANADEAKANITSILPYPVVRVEEKGQSEEEFWSKEAMIERRNEGEAMAYLELYGTPNIDYAHDFDDFDDDFDDFDDFDPYDDYSDRDEDENDED